jgi:hypothetical protein
MIHPLEEENRRLKASLAELEAQRDELAVSEARYASLQNRDEALNVAETLARSLAQTCGTLRNHSDLLKQIVNAEDAYYRDYHISNARAALAAIAPPPPLTQGEEERLWDIACDCLRFRKDDPLRLAETTTVERILAALRQRADEATRAENEACAKVADDYAQDGDVAALDIAADIRARMTQP